MLIGFGVFNLRQFKVKTFSQPFHSVNRLYSTDKFCTNMVLDINFKPNLQYRARVPVLFSFEVIHKTCEKKFLGLILIIKQPSLEKFSQPFHSVNSYQGLYSTDKFCTNLVLYINLKPNLHYQCARGPVPFSFEVIQKACEKKSLGLILVVKWMVSDVQTCTCQGRRNQGAGAVGVGAHAPFQILPVWLTLYQPGGQIMPTI